MTTEIALFPIPNLVAFPGTIVPLHVFEPRYRKMISDAVEQGMMVGPCHTRKEISPGKANQTMDQALSTNQATYEPCQIFSAGPCDVLEVAEDGRMHVQIQVIKRYRIESELQTLPYRIVAAAELLDGEEDEVDGALQVEINMRLMKIVGEESPELTTVLRSNDWQEQEAGEFSFRIFQFLRFEADAMQQILESTSAGDRLKQIDSLLAGPAG